mmetsp:Transcript_117446/g.292810  ORF Transcript_117446/g.292810 Transcript_117446/m.292810 type:complete len:212 (-) Transcript_117446:203-838(-)
MWTGTGKEKGKKTETGRERESAKRKGKIVAKDLGAGSGPSTARRTGIEEEKRRRNEEQATGAKKEHAAEEERRARFVAIVSPDGKEQIAAVRKEAAVDVAKIGAKASLESRTAAANAATVETARRKTRASSTKRTRQRQKVASLTEAASPVVAGREGTEAGKAPVKIGRRSRRKKVPSLAAATRSRSPKTRRTVSQLPMRTFPSFGLAFKS